MEHYGTADAPARMHCQDGASDAELAQLKGLRDARVRALLAARAISRDTTTSNQRGRNA
jgi:hypothetical protein